MSADTQVDALLRAAAGVLSLARSSRPVVVHLTNHVVMNDQANVTLAAGGSPLMSMGIEEQEELVRIASAVLVNIGTICRQQAETMKRAGLAAARLNKPVIFDPVGVGATSLRRDVTAELLATFQPAIIKGNGGEIAALAKEDALLARGVDSVETDTATAIRVVRSLAREHHTVAVLHGPDDYVSDGDRVVQLSNGHARLGTITGSGCSLGSVMATYVAAVGTDRARVFEAAIASVLTVTIAGEMAAASSNVAGPASYKVAWIDAISHITPDHILQHAKAQLV
ncbi:thiamine biosynthetic bifunctional enzyme [Cryptotrichosporon argae]